MVRHATYFYPKGLGDFGGYGGGVFFCFFFVITYFLTWETRLLAFFFLYHIFSTVPRVCR